jgi:hypothetical protein
VNFPFREREVYVEKNRFIKLFTHATLHHSSTDCYTTYPERANAMTEQKESLHLLTDEDRQEMKGTKRTQMLQSNFAETDDDACRYFETSTKHYKHNFA